MSTNVEVSNSWERQFVTDTGTSGRIWLASKDGKWFSPFDINDEPSDEKTILVEFEADLDSNYNITEFKIIRITFEEEPFPTTLEDYTSIYLLVKELAQGNINDALEC